MPSAAQFFNSSHPSLGRAEKHRSGEAKPGWEPDRSTKSNWDMFVQRMEGDSKQGDMLIPHAVSAGKAGYAV